MTNLTGFYINMNAKVEYYGQIDTKTVNRNTLPCNSKIRISKFLCKLYRLKLSNAAYFEQMEIANMLKRIKSKT